MTVIYIIYIAINNRLRGSSFYNKGISLFTSKPFTSLYAGIATYFITTDYIIGLIVFVGLYIWSILGWGKYFAAFHGRYSIKEKEFLPADFVGDLLFIKTKNAYLAGTVAMSIRALLILPMFLGFAIYQSSPLVALNGVICALLQGNIYWLMKFVPEKHALLVAELLTGGVIGSLILISINPLIIS